MSTYEKGQPVWFKRRPTSEKSKPDAFFSRTMSGLPNVIEVMHGGQPWICKLEEIAHPKTALAHIAAKWAKDIKFHYEDKMTKTALASLCGTSTTTLRARIGVCLRLKLLLEDPTAKKEKTK